MIAVAFVLAGYDWWWLLALFLAFDVSGLGYLRDQRIGALGYNLVHNYTGPALMTVAHVLLVAWGTPQDWLGLIAGCWAFHIAVDRAIGYGLKFSDSPRHTHLTDSAPAVSPRATPPRS